MYRRSAAEAIKLMVLKNRPIDYHTSDIVQFSLTRPPKMKTSVFLSHNHRDKPFVRRLAADLMSYGVSVWIEDAEIKIGDSLIKKIEEGINDSRFLAVILSPNSVGSSWVQNELNTVMAKGISQKTVSVLPVLYRDCEMPQFLIDRRYVDFRDEQQYDIALDMLLERVGAVSGNVFSGNPKADAIKILTLALECWRTEQQAFIKQHRPDVSALFLEDVSYCLLEYCIGESRSLSAEHPNATDEERRRLKPIAFKYQFSVSLSVYTRTDETISISESRQRALDQKTIELNCNVTRFTSGSWLVMSDI